MANESPTTNTKAKTGQGPQAPEVGMYGEDPFGDHYTVIAVEDDFVTIRYASTETRAIDYDEWPKYAPNPDIDQQEYIDGFEGDPDSIPTVIAAVPEVHDVDPKLIDEAIHSRSLERVAIVTTEVERRLLELEAESAAASSDYRKRIKTLRARRADLLHEQEELTHTWVCDHSVDLAYLVTNDDADPVARWIAERSVAIGDVRRDELAGLIASVTKRTRPLAPEDRQETLPFAAEG